MSNADPTTADNRPRRAFLFARSAEAGEIERRIAVAGYETRLVAAAPVNECVRAITDFAPDVALIEIAAGATSESEEVALVRRLRAEPQFFALPIVILFCDDARSSRNLASNLGVDDYFSADASADEIRARLDALFWRMEVGRRNAPVVGDQRSEIDNFVALLDSVRADAASGTGGTLALIEPVLHDEAAKSKQARNETLQKAHGFLKLNLRRIDAVTFYGPTTLLVYLPRTATGAARANLNRLRSEFLNTRPAGDIAIGLASFPSDANDVENLIEKAEAAIARARRPEARVRIASEGEMETHTPRGSAQAKNFTRGEKSEIAGDIKREASASLRAPVASSITHTSSVTQISNARGAAEDGTIPATVESAARDTDGTSAPHTADEAAAQERERRASGAAMPRRVLLAVSDAARLAQLNSLMRAAGYEVRAAFDAGQALDFLRLERPDLLLLDHELRDMSGLEMLRRLRKQAGENLTVPVMIIAAQGSEIETTREAISLGARRVVALPCDPAEFLASVRTTGNVE